MTDQMNLFKYEVFTPYADAAPLMTNKWSKVVEFLLEDETVLAVCEADYALHKDGKWNESAFLAHADVYVGELVEQLGYKIVVNS